LKDGLAVRNRILGLCSATVGELRVIYRKDLPYAENKNEIISIVKEG
jgi:hypothetical protein